jgi:hypothetical protein
VKPAARAFKQLQPQHFLKARQLAADRWLRGMQHLCGFGEIAGGHHGVKNLDMA